MLPAALLLAVSAGLCACTTGTGTQTGLTTDETGAGQEVAAAEPEARARQHLGKTYQMAGKWYTPKADPDYDETGMASWYGARFHGRSTANGEIFDRVALTAAHPTLPLPSYVRVTNLDNDRSIIVRVNDRGPFAHNRLIDVSERTAELLGFKHAGKAEVRVEYAGAADVDADDASFLLASYQGPQIAPPEQAPVMLAAHEPPPQPPAAAPREPAPVQVAAAAPPAPPAAALPAEAPVQAAVAFADTDREAAGDAGALDAVDIVTAGYSADDRILMAFESISAPGR